MANSASVGKNYAKRARKTCSRCHERKTRCDVAETFPCSSCVEAGRPCNIRKRKNARKKISSPPPTPGPSSTFRRASSSHTVPSLPNAALDPSPSLDGAYVRNIASNIYSNDQIAPDSFPESLMQPQPQSQHSQILLPPPRPQQSQQQPQQQGDLVPDPPSIDSSYFDFSTINDLEQIFSTTYDDTVGALYETQQEPSFEVFAGGNHGHPGDGLSSRSNTTSADSYAVSLSSTLSLDPAAQQYLESQGCLNLPPPTVLQQLMQSYFAYIHPGLPVLQENEIWAMWAADGTFNLGSFSYLVLKAMIFAAMHFLPADVLNTHLGCANKREARGSAYAQAKLLFSFNVEKDPICLSQACLLLTHYAPHNNFLRVNSYWLSTSFHFAQCAGASAFPTIAQTDPVRGSILKRLWWCLLFRDRSLSLCLRRPMTIDHPLTLSDEAHLLQLNDFMPEIGLSPIHDRDTQIRLILYITCFCRLINALTPALQILYRHQRIDQRLTDVKLHSPYVAFTNVRHALDGLHAWHARAIEAFPSPLTLDLDETSTGAPSIFGNMLFTYCHTALFALHQFRILLDETLSVPEVNLPSDLGSSVAALEHCVVGIESRLQEVLQARLAKYLPMSVSAILALPLILRALNVTLSRGEDAGTESGESRKLQVLTRILDVQVGNFDGSDFIGEVLHNFVAYATRENFPEGGRQMGGGNGMGRTSPQWPELMKKRPRLLLRLLLRLDRTLCTGVYAEEDFFPKELR